MSTNQTASYQLHLWEPGDDFLREEFNENFEALDDASRIVFGVYVGDGAATRNILLGFTPQAVLVENQAGTRENSGSGRRGGLALPGHTCERFGTLYVEIIDGGFRVSAESKVYNTNAQDGNYYYMAVR